MANIIKIKRKTTAGNPSPAVLADGELVWNEVDKKLGIKALGLFEEITSPAPSITSGTAAPSGGSDGDIYLQYT